MVQGVIESALREDWGRLAPLVRHHFSVSEGHQPFPVGALS
jgi:hypothetical protein